MKTGMNLLLWTGHVTEEHYKIMKDIKDAGNTGDSLGLPTFIAGEPRFYGMSLTLRH